MKPIVQLITSTAPRGVSGRWDWAKAGSIALGAGAVMLLGGVVFGQQLGLIPEEIATTLTGMLITYALAKLGLKLQAGVDPEQEKTNTAEDT